MAFDSNDRIFKEINRVSNELLQRELKRKAKLDFEELYREDYWEKLSRLSSSPHNRIMRTEHQSRHKTTYVIGLLHDEDGPIFLPVVCKTLSVMEVINKENPPCFICTPRGKLRAQLHPYK